MESDPTPGNPDEVRTLADDLQTFADDVGEALGKIRGLAGDSAVQDWSGLSADAFRDEFDGVPENLTKLRNSYDLCAQALQTYWPKLETAQGDADRALERAIAAQADLTAAQNALGDAQDWVSRAGDEADRLEREGEGAQPPDDAEVRAATRDRQAAQQAQESAQGRVDDAQGRLDAARQLAEQAREMREDAAREAARDIDEASDAGIQNRKWWEDAIHWVTENWDTIVDVCKAIVAVLGIVVMIIGGPLAWVVLAAALVVLADTLIKYARGEAGLLDVAFAVLDCIPGMKGLTTLGGLARGLKGGLAAARTGLKGLRQGALQLGRRTRGDGIPMNGRTACGDPVDMATGELLLSATDVSLPGVLPLVLERHHISSYRAGRLFGTSWASTLDQRLVLDAHGVRFFTADGMTLVYPRPIAGEGVLPVEGPRWELHWDGRPSSTLTVVQRETGRTLHFGQVPGHHGTDLPITAITDRHNNAISFAHDDRGAPTGIVHTAGYHIGITTERGVVTALRLLSHPDRPVLLRFGHDPAGSVTEVVNSSGRPLTFRYDDQYRLIRWEDRNGYWYSYAYDETGRCVRTDGSGHALRFHYAYDSANHRTAARDSLGNTTTFQFDDCYRLTSVTDPLGNSTAYQHDRYDRLLSVTDPVGHTSRYEYDDLGDIVAVVRADGSARRMEYDALGSLTRLRQPDGAVWTQTFDDAGNRVELVDPLGNRTRFTHHDTGGPATISDAAGHTVRIRCDAAGLPVEVTDAGGGTTVVTRDAFGRAVEVTDQEGGVTEYTWTPEGRPSRRTAPTGAVQTFVWDAEGNLLRATDPNGGVTSYTYGAFDMVASRTTPDGVTYTFERDTRLLVTGVVTSYGTTWDYSYDAAGRLIGESDFDGRVTTYHRDPAGRVVRRTNAAGQSVAIEYDVLGRRVRKAASDGTVTTFAHDPLGRVLRATSPGVVVDRTYDPVGNLLSETVNGRTLAMTYDAVGQWHSRRTPSGHTSVWTYAPTRQPATLSTGGHLLTFTHDRAGRERSRHLDGLATLTRTWDAGGRRTSDAVTGSDGLSLLSRHYDYRADGSPVRISDAHEGSRAFSFDEMGRVVTVATPDGEESYGYDAAGNQSAAHWPSGGTETQGARQYTGSLLTRAGRTEFRYDGAGRVVARERAAMSKERGAWRYVWNAEDQLVSATTPDGTVWRYAYDPFGRRTAKKRLADDGAVAERTDFTWHRFTLVEQETTRDGGSHVLTWDHQGLEPITQTARSTHGPGVEQDFRAVVTDLVGMPTHLLGAGADVTRAVSTNLWGSETAPATAHTPLRFPGQYADEETGWHYNLYRHYDPDTARYTSPDPLGLVPSPNAFTYVVNPLTWTDPLGLSAHPEDDLYRGVWPDHPDFADAVNGDVIPTGWGKPGPKLTPEEHNGGVLGLSDYSSWTTRRSLAEQRATENGVVLRVSADDYPTVPSPDYFDEAEVLIEGPVNGAERLR
ncbi:RHS repeat-associated core domain-containing protein [Streptomyces sp. RFCAC02]|uniref:RHS repeat-associated core domain-containing protein n=1 Tax=Streptomyces sp. RFCAC02 TaxID=2499143 RepID=UPI003208A450